MHVKTAAVYKANFSISIKASSPPCKHASDEQTLSLQKAWAQKCSPTPKRQGSVGLKMTNGKYAPGIHQDIHQGQDLPLPWHRFGVKLVDLQPPFLSKGTGGCPLFCFGTFPRGY